MCFINEFMLCVFVIKQLMICGQSVDTNFTSNWLVNLKKEDFKHSPEGASAYLPES